MSDASYELPDKLAQEMLDADKRPEYDPTWPDSQRVAIARAIIGEVRVLEESNSSDFPGGIVDRPIQIAKLRQLSDFTIMMSSQFLHTNFVNFNGWFKPGQQETSP